jgi:predicted 3-demethylubiquinone-9 3-methyltransferase (glyoxalase superfamily)
MALNGGPMFTITEGISLVLYCDNQEEIDFFWSRLTAGGQESMCGWLKDPFGVSWQVLPAQIHHLLADPVKGEAAARKLMKMKKIDLEILLDPA